MKCCARSHPGESKTGALGAENGKLINTNTNTNDE